MDITNQQINPPQSNPQEPLTDNPAINQKGNALIIVGIIFLMVVIGIGAYYLGTQSSRSTGTQQPQVTTNSSVNEPTITATNKPSLTAMPDSSNLKAYTNQKMGFTIKYPLNLYIKEFDTSVAFTSEPYPTTEGPGPIDLIEISLKGSYMAPQFAALYKANVGDDAPEAHNAVDVKITKIRNLKFGKYDAVEYIRDGTIPSTSGLGRGPIGYEHNVLVKKNDQEFIDLLNDSMQQAKTEARDPIFNAMVSSFTLN